MNAHMLGSKTIDKELLEVQDQGLIGVVTVKAMFTMEGEWRRIRVHLAPHSTFIIECTGGTITAVTSDEFRYLLDRDEREVATELRKAGATFVDLIRERGSVQPARGYRAKIDL